MSDYWPDKRIAVCKDFGPLEYYDSLREVDLFSRLREGENKSPSVENAEEFPNQDNKPGRSKGQNKQQSITWIDISGIERDDVAALSSVLELHPLTSEDILLSNTREKCEVFHKYCFVCFEYLDIDSFEISANNQRLCMIIRNDITVTLHTARIYNPERILRGTDKLRRSDIRKSTDWYTYLILDEITDSLAPMVRYLEAAVESIDDLSFILKGPEQNDMVKRIGELRKKVSRFFKVIGNKNGILKIIISRSSQKKGRRNTLSPYFSDIKDKYIVMTHDLLYCERTLARARKNYLVQILIDITYTSQLINDAAMKVTVIACITFPLNFATGLFGMNVKVPLGEVDSYWPFTSLTIGMMFICALFFIYLRYKKVF